MASLKILSITRGHKRKQVTEIFNKRDEFGHMSRNQITATISKLKSLDEELKKSNEKILLTKFKDLDESSDEIASELEECDLYDQRILDALVLLEEIQVNPTLVSSPGISFLNPNYASNNNSNVLKPPVAPLPTFSDKEGDSLFNFFHSFESVIEKYSYSSYEKFILLKDRVSGRALALINSLEHNKQSYEDAKNLLMEALASPTTQKFETLDKLVNLKLPYDKDPYLYASEFRVIQESIGTLKIDVNFIIQYFIWKGMNQTLQNQFISITNVNRPSLELINTHLFAALERCQSMSKKYIERKSHSKDLSTSANAINISQNNNKFKPCSLCGIESDHPIYKCSKFSTPQSKIDKLLELKGCKLCSYLNHETKNCKFNFKNRCSRCNGKHFSFLCISSSKSSGEDKGKSKQQTTSNNVIFSTLSMQSSEKPCVLPTFTCDIGKSLNTRVLYDSGCQANFISQYVVGKNQFKVLDRNIKLTVNGFNTSKMYETKIVELPILLSSNERVSINAVVVPSIDIALKLPHLGKVVHIMQSRGLCLADKNLSSKSCNLTNIGLILGSESAFCLPVTTKLIGNNPPSCLLQTKQGVLLQGDLNLLERNLYSEYPNNSHTKSSTGNSVTNLVTTSEPNFDQNLVISKKGKIDIKLLDQALDKLSCKNISDILGYDQPFNEESNEYNDILMNFLMGNIRQLDNGRLEMPILWNPNVAHLLGKNYNLSVRVLQSNLRRLNKIENGLQMTDEVFKEWQNMGVIERIPNFDQFLQENPNCSFVPHMSVFRKDKESSPCRVVYLANICESTKGGLKTMSHSQVISSGPNLNSKILTNLILLRFDKFLLIFDIVKAFLNISIPTNDQNKLVLLWYSDVTRKNFTVTPFKTKRVPFGLPCSPALLMSALYKILIQDVDDDVELMESKRLMYSLAYMDNIAYSSPSEKSIKFVYDNVKDIFGKYCFDLQQFASNEKNVSKIWSHNSSDTVNLLGMHWNTSNDTISMKKLNLNANAKTKRQCLQTLAENFDPFQINTPILNRARIFVHDLQCDKSLSWDDDISKSKIADWKNLSSQVNSSHPIHFPRYLGDRKSSFDLLCFTDASKKMYGYVIYLRENISNRVSLLCSKSKLVNTQLSGKGVPTLEFQALTYGLESMINIYSELTDSRLAVRIKFNSLILYTDSMVSLSWLRSYHCQLEKRQSKTSIFIMNRLNQIGKICERHSVTFKFIEGCFNPADVMTKPISHKLLMRSNYISGPECIYDAAQDSVISVTLPDKTFKIQNLTCSLELKMYHLIPIDRFSSLDKLLNAYCYVFKFIHKLKSRVEAKRNDSFVFVPYNYRSKALDYILWVDQNLHFSKIFNFFSLTPKNVKDIPNLVNQLNIAPDGNNLLRVYSKFFRKSSKTRNNPILLSKNSQLTRLIILSMHCKLSHIGRYTLLSELRKVYYVPSFYSVVKKVIKSCIFCKRLNERAINLNQSPYREFRGNPPPIPYQTIFLDYIGPFLVKDGTEKNKVWLLCVSCCWSRSINLIICRSLTVDEFRIALQLH